MRDLVKLHMDAKKTTDPADFYRDLSQALGPQVRSIRRVFIGVGLQTIGAATNVGELTKQQFFRFMKDCGLVETSKKEHWPVGAKLMNPGEVDLLFQRANMTGLQGRGGGGPNIPSMDDILGELDAGGDVELDDEEEEDDDDVGAMVLYEFVAALIRAAWSIFMMPGMGIGKRLELLFQRAILPRCQDMIQFADPFRETWASPRVQAITEHYHEDIVKIFRAFAASDKTVTAASDCSMSLQELFFLMGCGELLDTNLTGAQLTAIFTRVNAVSMESGGDDDAQELDEEEFVEVLARCCRLKIQSTEPFEFTWQSFLHLVFLPQYKKLVKKGKHKSMRSSIGGKK